MDLKWQPPALPVPPMQQSLSGRVHPAGTPACSASQSQPGIPLPWESDPALGARSCCGGWVHRTEPHPWQMHTWYLLVDSCLSVREEKILLDTVTLMRHWEKRVAGCYICRMSFLPGTEIYFIFHHLQSVPILKTAPVCGSLSTKQGRNPFCRTNPWPHPFSCREGWQPPHTALSQTSRSKSKCHSTLSDDSTRFTLISTFH